MSKVPGVCIMIPTYNQANFIQRAVDSALAQDYSNIEIIIADDNSNDTTATVVLPYLERTSIKYMKNETNIGRVANYRKCLQEYAKADWVINLDGDDYFTNDQYISQAMEAIQINGIDNILFYQGVNIIKGDQYEKLIEPNILSKEVCIDSDDYFFNFFKRNYFSHMSTLYNRQLAVESNFYSNEIISADIFSLLQLCLKNNNKKVIVSKNISGVWYQHGSNISKSQHIKKHYDNFGLYIKLYRLAVEKGFKKWRCFAWLMKAGFIYVGSYLYSFIKNKQQVI